jgi:two-component system, NtrC family, sensor kinase
MRLGIRLQVLLALGALLVLAFVPLFFAVASLTRAAFNHLHADSAVLLGPLLRLVAMYTGIVGLGFLVIAYFAMTRLVVRPIVELQGAARRVREGGRRFEVVSGPAEILDLAHSIAQMTENLRVEEAMLRAKVAEVERYAADLTRAQERLVRSERLASVGRLSAGLAHEIGNPISAILGFQELLLMGGLSREEERDFVERMKRETERIHKVLRDLLDFARPAAQPRDAEVERPCSVHDAVSDAAALVRPQRGWKEVELETEIAPGLPLVTIGHERLVQVLLNLLLNAGDAVPKDHARVLVRASLGADGRARIEVEDNGHGIAKEIEPRLFEPFATTKDVGKGTGLGLAVCRGLVEAAGGAISAERGALGGARFVVDLPVAS